MVTAVRIALLAAVLAIATSLACTSSGPPPTLAARPSILLLTVDTLRADRMAPASRAAEVAPFLTALAAESTVFAAAHSTSSWTVPAAVTLATGLYPQTHGITIGISHQGGVVAQPVIPDSVPRLAAALGDAGYRTYAVLANGHMGADLGFAQGFNRFACVGFRNAETVTAALAPWHAELSADPRPFFLWLHFFDPHLPYHPREPWFSRYAPEVTAADREVLARARETWPALPPEVAARPGHWLTIARALYDSEVSYLDDAVARLYRELPVLDRCLLVFTADHGEEFREHGRIGHGNNLYATSLHVPLWVRLPGGGRGTVSERVVSLVDVPPTIARAAGAVVPASWPGVSLLAPVAAEREVVAQLAKVPTRRLEALVGPRWKLVRTEPAGTSELFDLSADGGELRDLATTEPAVLARAEARLAAFRAALPAPAAPPGTVTVSPEELEMLEQLGYAEVAE